MAFDWSSFGTNVLTSGASEVAGGLIGQLFAKQNAARNYNYQVKLANVQDNLNRGLMSYQSDLSRQQAEFENSMSRKNLQDSPSIQKQGLLDAGLSPVLASGQPQVASTPSVGSPSASQSIPSFSADSSIGVNFAHDMLLAEQMRGVSLDNQLKKVELKYADPSKRAALDTALESLRQLKDSFPVRLDEMKARIRSSDASTRLSNKQLDKVDKEIDKLVQETQTISINNKYLDRMNDMQLRELDSKVKLNLARGRYEKVVADLAEVGIIVGADWFTQLAAVIHQGTAPEIMTEVVKFVDDIFSNFGSNLSGLSSAVIDGIKQSVKDFGSKFNPFN